MSDENVSQDVEESRETDAQSSAQTIFDERFKLFTEDLGAACEKEGVKAAVAIIDDPKMQEVTKKGPMVFLRGDRYHVAKMLADLLRRLQAEIMREITV